MRSVWTIGVGLFLIVISFAGGYFFRSQSCISQSNVTLAPTPTVSQITSVPTQAQNVVLSPTPNLTTVPTKQPETDLVFSNYNSAGVSNKPTAPTVFALTQSRVLYSIQDYHWNSAQGKTPGTIALKSTEGKEYGPWTAEGAPGQGGVPNAYWTVYPNTEVPAGTYTIVDSDPASWAQNSGSKGLGMSQVYAVK